MSVFQLGSIIKNRREELGFTQEDLADGICSVPTLSRIENGERMPTKDHFEMLMQRLGYSMMSLDFFTDRRDFRIHEYKIRLRYAYISRDTVLVKHYLEELERLVVKPTKIDKQFLILYQTLLGKNQYKNSEKLKRFEDALALTCSGYKFGRIPHVLSYEEIILLNNIAICYATDNDHDYAIFILMKLKEYYEHNMICKDEALRTQPMVLYNLSKSLGLSGRYDECIEICDLGIRIAVASGRCPMLGVTLFNKAWALMQRNKTGDRENAVRCLRRAYSFAEAIDDHSEMEYLQNFLANHFAEEISTKPPHNL